MRVAVIGCRQCGGLTVEEVISRLPGDCTEIVSGGAVGVDRLARLAARKLGLPLTEFLPDYEIFGRQAPLVRNRQIVEYADCVIAFWDYRSRGTRHAILRAQELQKPVRIIAIPAE